MFQKKFKNWSGLVQFAPKTYWEPKSEQEILEHVQFCIKNDQRIRVMGNRHSFTPLIQTDQNLMSLKSFKGITSVDSKLRTAWVRAGTHLKEVGQSLYDAGLAQENLGDIDAQSLAGAFSTGTHGTGLGFGLLSTQVSGIKMVTGQGKLIHCSESQDREIFKAAQLSLGALGVITEVELKLLPRYRLQAISQTEKLSECVESFQVRSTAHRHFEFFWFPYADKVISKITDATESLESYSVLKYFVMEVLLENLVFESINRVGRAFPRLCPKLNRLLTSLAESSGVSRRTDWSYRVFATPRWSKFYEMEYGIPIGKLNQVIEEIQKLFKDRKFKVTFPIEVRSGKADDIFLSPANSRDSAFIAIHMFNGMDYRSYFNEMEKVFLKYDGRPHWGKMHSLTSSELSRIHPQYNRFIEIYHALDPKGVFTSTYLSTLLRQKS